MLLYLQCPASAVNPGSSLSFLEKFCQDISAQDGYLLSFMNQKSPSSLQHLALTSQLHGWKEGIFFSKSVSYEYLAQTWSYTDSFHPMFSFSPS
ncbi:hypothetical protein F2Q70_00000616 [Brassica cretica]|uniref:Uncharacterized protein n=1 Tax=Brassica cretica TaxID=69181 RepID=A0A8S9IW19_BRACR|nr:hypothetical protein F2Q70_00000616 [Brassica cretica]